MNRYLVIAIFIAITLLQSYTTNSLFDLRKRIYINKKVFYEFLKKEGKTSVSSLGITIADDIYLLDLAINNKKREAIRFLMDVYNLSKKDALDYIYNL